VLTLTGAALVWCGSLALAGGSAFAAGDDAAMALVNTHVAAAAAALAWLLIDRIAGARPGPTGFARGVVAGLAIAAPVAAYISPGAAIVLGVLAAVLAKGAARLVQQTLQIDDSLGVFAGHGVTGAAGTVLAAVLISPSLGGTGYGQGMDLAHQLVGQVVGVLAVAAWSAIATAIAALMVSMALPMRVTRDDELAGLDMASHGENAIQND
jgi:Amt family ammonium transporter